MKKYFVLLLVIFVQLSCGYRIAGLDDVNVKERFFVSNILNLTSESEYSSVLTSEIYDFFSKHNLLSKSKENTAQLVVRLKKINYESKILQSYSRATSSDLNIIVDIEVKKDGKSIYRNTFTDSNSYIISTNITETLNNRNEAFVKSINNILMDFINDYKEKNINSGK